MRARRAVWVVGKRRTAVVASALDAHVDVRDLHHQLAEQPRGEPLGEGGVDLRRRRLLRLPRRQLRALRLVARRRLLRRVVRRRRRLRREHEEEPVDGDDHRLAAEVAPRDLDADRAEPRADDAERQLERRERRRAQLELVELHVAVPHRELERLGVDAVDERPERLLEHRSDGRLGHKNAERALFVRKQRSAEP